MRPQFDPKDGTPEQPLINYDYLLMKGGFRLLQSDFSTGADLYQNSIVKFEFDKKNRERRYTIYETINQAYKQGFVEYDEKFEDYLQEHLDKWVKSGLKIINKHVKEISNDSMIKQYLVIQLKIVERLKNDISETRNEKNPNIKESLEKIKREIKSDYEIILKEVDFSKKTDSIASEKITTQKTKQPNPNKNDKGFKFDSKPKNFLLNLYNLEIDDEFVINQSKTSYESFKEVFSASYFSDVASEHSVHFNFPITKVGSYILALKKAYSSKVSYASIGRSGLFFTEKGTPLTATNISKNLDKDFAEDIVDELNQV